jgi:uncharacterized protein YdaU (DUF1376 family)
MSGVVPFPTNHNGGPTMEDAPAYTDRNRRRDPWFKFYPADWLRDTRNLTLEQRGAYIDSIAIQMERGESIPDDVSWLAHQLHISTRKARSLVQQLVDAKMLLRKNGQLTNNRCEREIAERDARHANVSHSAAVRERAKRESPLNQVPVNDEPELNQAPVSFENPEKLNENNKTLSQSEHDPGPTRAGARAQPDTDTELEDTLSNESVSKGEKDPPAPRPPGGGAAQERLDRRWQAVTEKAERKSSRPRMPAALARRMGELDGSRGILFHEGKLEIAGDAADALLTDFPGLDLTAICNRASLDVAKLNSPTFEAGMSALRKAAQYALEDARREQARRANFANRGRPTLGGRAVDQVLKSLPKERQQEVLARMSKGAPNAR